tara:strand:- start:4712 stop:5812 length:1101 start_codon:yes stop_codon:yes gene_type:complete
MKNKFNLSLFLKKIFKTFSYKLFFLFYGKISVNKKYENKIIKKKTIRLDNKFKYSIYECNNSRIYTNRIQDTAVIHKNIILSALSFQLRNNNFSKNIKDNIALKIGTPRKLKKINGTLVSLLTGGGGNNNFFHWMFDVLPKIAIIEKYYDLKKIDYFLCPDLNRWQLQTLILLGLKKEQCLSSVKFRHVQANKIITVSHPWLRSKNIVKDIENLPIWISKWLRKKFINIKSNKNFSKKIYIDRSDTISNYRKIINENDLKILLKKKGFKFFRLANLNFKDEVQLFYNAKKIVGLQGAGLTNLIWCRKNTRIIEIRSRYTNKLYENLSIQNNLNFLKIQSKPLEKNIKSHSVGGTLKINLKKLDKIL